MWHVLRYYSMNLSDNLPSYIWSPDSLCLWCFNLSAQEVIDGIKACKDLRWLRLEGNTLGVKAAKGIGKALERHPEFQVSW